MKNGFLIFALMWFVTITLAQGPTLKVVATAGGTYSGNSMQLDWTIGEVLINTFENSTSIISQGMHQPTYTITSTKIIPYNTGTIQISPNPTSDYVELTVDLIKSSEVEIQMTNMLGQSIWKKKYSGDKISNKYFLKDWLPGTYLITINVINLSALQTFQIIKTN